MDFNFYKKKNNDYENNNIFLVQKLGQWFPMEANTYILYYIIIYLFID
jgi:hypothetical protein